MQKEVNLDERFGSKWKGKYVFESISWGDSNRISGECTTIDPVSRRSTVNLDKLNAQMVLATLKVKPDTINMDSLMGRNPVTAIPVALGELLSSLADLVNGYGPKDREDLKNLKRQWGLE